MGNIQDLHKNYLAIIKSTKLTQDKKVTLLTDMLTQIEHIFVNSSEEREQNNLVPSEYQALYSEINTALNVEQEKHPN